MRGTPTFGWCAARTARRCGCGEDSSLGRSARSYNAPLVLANRGDFGTSALAVQREDGVTISSGHNGEPKAPRRSIGRQSRGDDAIEIDDIPRHCQHHRAIRRAVAYVFPVPLADTNLVDRHALRCYWGAISAASDTNSPRPGVASTGLRHMWRHRSLGLRRPCRSGLLAAGIAADQHLALLAAANLKALGLRSSWTGPLAIQLSLIWRPLRIPTPI